MDLLQLMFFAGLAVFLAVRLYMVLGRPTGRTHEEHVSDQAQQESASLDREEVRSVSPISQHYAGPAGEGLLDISKHDKAFDPDTFVPGAREAYKIIVDAYAKGDIETLKPLLTSRVFSAYQSSISQRERSGETVTTELERVVDAQIAEASLNNDQARVRVAFTAELASETRNSSGERIEGDLNTLKTVKEIWSFERDVSSDNPNWFLSGVKTA